MLQSWALFNNPLQLGWSSTSDGYEGSATPRPSPLPPHASDPANSSPEPPPTLLLAFFLRYPNPFARHVLSVDVLERTVDPVTGRIKTTRLILKRGIVPQWASKFLPVAKASGGRGLDAWVLEESVVDPPGWGVEEEAAVAAGPSSQKIAEDMIEVYRREPRLRVWQANLSFKKFMHVIEGGELCAGPNG